MSVIPALLKQKQEDCRKFWGSLGHSVSFGLATTLEQGSATKIIKVKTETKSEISIIWPAL